jgi:hypothetical protein
LKTRLDESKMSRRQWPVRQQLQYRTQFCGVKLFIEIAPC